MSEDNVISKHSKLDSSVRTALERVATKRTSERAHYAPPSAASLDRTFELLDAEAFSLDVAQEEEEQAFCFDPFFRDWGTVFRPVLEESSFTLSHVVRLAVIVGKLKRWDGPFVRGLGEMSGRRQTVAPIVCGLPDVALLAKQFQKLRRIELALSDLALELGRIGVEAHEVADGLFDPSHRPGWTDSEVWPLYADQSELLAWHLQGKVKIWRKAALEILAAMPTTPEPLDLPLWEVALGKNTTERPLAQRALDGNPTTAAKLAAALRSGKQTDREQAANWLRERGDRGSLSALRDALEREKKTAVKASIQAAIDSLTKEPAASDAAQEASTHPAPLAYVLPEAKRIEFALDDFEGSRINSDILATLAKELGYRRGEVDLKLYMFASYARQLQGTDVWAIIEITALRVDSGPRPVFLRKLRFQYGKPEDFDSIVPSVTPVMLCDVHPQFLSDVRSDLAKIAAAGEGFDPDWKARSIE